MEVIKYLNKEAIISGHEGALNKLQEELGIKNTYNEEYDLYVLNYSQIDSPKTHPIVTECRSLVVEHLQFSNIFKVVSRSFDRFLNLGENGNENKIAITEMTAHEKLDGSLIGLFHHNGEWLYRTKSMIMPPEEMHMNAFGISWKSVIEQALGDYSSIKNSSFASEWTFILELTSPHNRIVTRYEDTKVTLLAVRHNMTGVYQNKDNVYDIGLHNNWSLPRTYSFDTIDQCKEVVSELPNLEEGYVLYDKNNVPICKVKSPKYLAVHRLRGECTPTPKRIMDLVFTNETDEYLAYFPEDKHLFEPYVKSFEVTQWAFEQMWSKTVSIGDQKEFALAVKDTPVATLLFQKRKNNNLTFKQLFNKLNDKSKYRVTEAYLNEN